MPATNEVRVFLCSTFADFELERRLVHEEVAPPLREVCAHYGLRFSLIDLRYGITERDATVARVNELCLLEVSRCARISPELSCLGLLGHRYGSRLVPRELETLGLESLLSSLVPRLPAHARLRRLLTRIYDLEHAGTRVRRAAGGQDAIDEFLRDTEVLAVLQSIAAPDPAGEAVRSALGFSVTHQELLQAGALSSGAGVVTVLRNVVHSQSGIGTPPASLPSWSGNFVDDGPARAAQERLREAVSASQCATVILEMPVMDAGQISPEYAERFRKVVLPPLHERTLRARGRGTRIHRFMGLARPDPLDAEASPDEVEGKALERWLDDPPSGPLAVVTEAGAFRANLLAHLEMAARMRGYQQVIRLDATASPEIGDYRNFAIAVLVAVGGPQAGLI